jgi:arginine N-succinyltransferase
MPGRQLSYVRFLYMAIFPERFRATVLAELMPPLTADGKSLFWEACGRRFTSLDYQEADKRSRQNKEFIQQLFPAGDVYATLFPERVQKVIGQVGPETVGVMRMLERIGFRHLDRIDPFDGGPHFEARVSDITLVQQYRRMRLADAPLQRDGADKLVAVVKPGDKVRFRCVRAQARCDGDEIQLPALARERLQAATGERIHVIPFE